MNFVESIKSKIEEYKQYKNPIYLSKLTVQNSKKRNIFNYIQAKSLGRKYGELLYRHFLIEIYTQIKELTM